MYNQNYQQPPQNNLQLQNIERRLEKVEEKAKTAYFIGVCLAVLQIGGFFLAVIFSMSRGF